MAGASGVMALRALALYCTPKKPHTPADGRGPRRRAGPRAGGVRRRAVARAGGVKAGGKGGVRGRGGGK